MTEKKSQQKISNILKQNLKYSALKYFRKKTREKVSLFGEMQKSRRGKVGFKLTLKANF